MDNDIDLKNIWKQQKVEKISITQLHIKLKKLRKQKRKEQFLINGISILSIAVFITIWNIYEFKLITSKIGITLGFIAILFYALYYNKINLKFNKEKQFEINSEYLKGLIAYHSKNKRIQTKSLGLYLIILFVGISLYSYEYLSKIELKKAVIIYSIICFWFLINWFYLRPKTIRKKNEKIETIINEYKRINTELNK